MMPVSAVVAKPPSVEYSDEVLYGPRRDGRKLAEAIRQGNNSECVMFTIKTYADKQEWTIKNLVGLDKRLKCMIDKLDIKHALPVQRYTWPQIHRSSFPVVCISPESTGKTYAQLLYAVAQCITAAPISKTDEMIFGSNQDDTYVIDAATKNQKNKPANDCDEDIDFDDLDLDNLNQENVQPQEVKETKENENPQEEKQVLDTWGGGDEADLDDLISHPKFIIITYSQPKVEDIERTVNLIKEAAYDIKAVGPHLNSFKNMPPLVKTINVHESDDNLALNCNESEILIGTPGAFIKCFQSEYLNFAKCKKVFFDDVDISLQQHNKTIRELIKYYIVQTREYDNLDSSSASFHLCLFARKWTDLLKQFVSVLPQRILIFGSIMEASVYANIRFDLEIYTNEDDKVAKLINLVKLQDGLKNKAKLALVCRKNLEAQQLSKILIESGFSAKFLPQDEALKALGSRTYSGCRDIDVPEIYVMCDKALELVANFLNDTTHVIHYTFPMSIIDFDQRFRLLYKHIISQDKEISSTIFFGPQFSKKYAKELYDLLARSNTTMSSTKMELRDYISNYATWICWRWATIGLCRLEKLSRNDRFGSYCPDRHSVTLHSNETDDKAKTIRNRWPGDGQFKITISHIVSPSEFYFWFEAHRDENSVESKWTDLKNSGCKFMRQFQVKLNELKNTPCGTVDLELVKRGAIFAFYQQQETKVDRVMLLEGLHDDDYEKEYEGKKVPMNKKLEMSKLLRCFKIDYGYTVTVYVSNLIPLPESLRLVEPQAHRGFHLGIKPTDNEPDWLYKAKKQFFDSVSGPDVSEITVWCRLNSDNCFWFENMLVTSLLKHVGGRRILRTDPYVELCRERLAESTSSALPCLNPPSRLRTLSKWSNDNASSYAQYAKLSDNNQFEELFILDVLDDLSLMVRQTKFNKQLIQLEDKIADEYMSGKLVKLNYREAGVYCIAHVSYDFDPKTNEPIYMMNRCQIIGKNPQLEGSSTETYLLNCLDHGDVATVGKEGLYQVEPNHLSQLSFQAIQHNIGDLNKSLLDDQDMAKKVRQLILKYTRSEHNDMLEIRCEHDRYCNGLYVYVPADDNVAIPLIDLMEKDGIKLVNDEDPILRKKVAWDALVNEERICSEEDACDIMIRFLLLDIYREELQNYGIDV